MSFTNPLWVHPTARAALRARPPWASLVLKICVTGILALPVATPLVLHAGSPPLRQPGFLAALGVWLVLFAGAWMLVSMRTAEGGR